MSTCRFSLWRFMSVVLLPLLALLTPSRTSAVGTDYPNALFAVPTEGSIRRQMIVGGHPGIDIGGAGEAPVYAAYPGTVIYVGRDPHNPEDKDTVKVPPHIVIIDHGWVKDAYTMTMYVHMGKEAAVNVVAQSYILPAIQVGTVVQMGTQLGRQGCAGNCSGTHLHFEVRQRAQPWRPGPKESDYWDGNIRQPGDFIFGTPVNNGTYIRYRGPATTQPFQVPGFFRIVASHSGKCLDVSGASTANGGNVQQWDCVGPLQVNQLWSLRPTSNGFQVVARHSGKCLDVSGVATHSGANIHQWDCHGGANQRWQLRRFGGTYELRPMHTDNMCMDVSGAGVSNGTNVQQWDCTGGANQRWLLRPAGAFEIKAKHSGKCLEVAGGALDNMAKVQQWDCVGGFNQRWQLLPVGDGFRVVAMHSGKSLDVSGGGTHNGAQVQQWDYVGGANQRWLLDPVGDAFRLTPMHATNKSLDVSGASQDNGGNVQLWDYVNGPNQQWRLVTP